MFSTILSAPATFLSYLYINKKTADSKNQMTTIRLIYVSFLKK